MIFNCVLKSKKNCRANTKQIFVHRSAIHRFFFFKLKQHALYTPDLNNLTKYLLFVKCIGI